jgi:hypothetical protein
MATGSEGANRRQVRVTRDPASPAVGATAQVALAGTATVAVEAGVERVVEAAVGVVVVTDEGAEDAGAAVWSAVRDAQPVTAKAAAKTTVVMIRTGRMATPPNNWAL